MMAEKTDKQSFSIDSLLKRKIQAVAAKGTKVAVESTTPGEVPTRPNPFTIAGSSGVPSATLAAQLLQLSPVFNYPAFGLLNLMPRWPLLPGMLRSPMAAHHQTTAAVVGGQTTPAGRKPTTTIATPTASGSGGGGAAPSVGKQAPLKKYKCDVCTKAFSRSNTLITHKRIHTGEKPFKCEHCGRAFRQPGNLTRHRLTHTTVKPYICQQCGKAFNRASNLHTHMRTHTSYRPFVCPYCRKGFHQKIDMKIHIYTHTGERPFRATFGQS